MRASDRKGITAQAYHPQNFQNPSPSEPRLCHSCMRLSSSQHGCAISYSKVPLPSLRKVEMGTLQIRCNYSHLRQLPEAFKDVHAFQIFQPKPKHLASQRYLALNTSPPRFLKPYETTTQTSPNQLQLRSTSLAANSSTWTPLRKSWLWRLQPQCNSGALD